MKNSSRIRFLHCFKPEGSPGHVFQHGLPDDSEEHLTYRDIAEESSPSSNSKKGAIMRTVKAVLFKTVLASRIRKRRQQVSSKSYRSINSGRTIADFLDDEVVRDDDTSISQVSRLPTLSEPYSSLDQLAFSSESQNGVADLKTEEQGKRGRRRKRMVCAFVVVLAATVFLGRSWAMLLASTWICITCIYTSIGHGRNKARYKGRATNQSTLNKVKHGSNGSALKSNHPDLFIE